MPGTNYYNYVLRNYPMPVEGGSVTSWTPPNAPIPYPPTREPETLDEGVMTLENLVTCDGSGYNTLIEGGNQTCIVYKVEDGVRHTYLIDTVGGGVIAWSRSGRPLWGGSRPFTKKEDGDGAASNILDLIPDNGGKEMFDSIADIVNDVFSDSTDETEVRLRDLMNPSSPDGGVMCGRCGNTSGIRGQCDSCGAYFGGADMDNLARLDGADLTEYKTDGVTEKMKTLLTLARDDKVNIGFSMGHIVYTLPIIHLENASRHRFTRIANKKKVDEYVTNGEGICYMTYENLFRDGKIDGYIKFLEDFGSILVANPGESVLIGDVVEVDRARAAYIRTSINDGARDMASAFFGDTSDRMRELAVPLYTSMMNRYMLSPTVQHSGHVNWDLGALTLVASKSDVKLELLGIINNIMTDDEVDSVMEKVGRNYGS